MVLKALNQNLPESAALRDDCPNGDIAMNERIEKHGLLVDKALHDFIVTEAMPGTGVEPDAFWSGFAAILADLAPKNRALLAKRD